MELFTRLFGDWLTFAYHCFDRIVIHGHFRSLSRPEQVVHFVRHVLGVPVVSKEVLSRRTVGGWTAKQIHEAVLTTFQLSPKTYGLNQLRYDLRKLKGHGPLQREPIR
jgi:hypothetical protein